VKVKGCVCLVGWLIMWVVCDGKHQSGDMRRDRGACTGEKQGCDGCVSTQSSSKKLPKVALRKRVYSFQVLRIL
jgi:hypothetical protein